MFKIRLFGLILSLGLCFSMMVSAQEENNKNTQTQKHSFQVSGQSDAESGSIKIMVDGEIVYEKEIELDKNWKENVKELLDKATELPEDVSKRLKDIELSE